MQARNRKLEDWYGKIKRGEIKLPRFQRFEAWDKKRICSLLDTVIHNLPLGITLVLEVDEEKFVSRFLQTAPETNNRVYEHLLDGQQRLTELWRAFHNNYEWYSYFIYLKEFDDYEYDEEHEDLSVYSRGRYYKSGERYPLWCDKPDKCLQRGFIPTFLLKPEDIQHDIDNWIIDATKHKEPTEDINAVKDFHRWTKRISDRIMQLRSIVANYNLPYLSLPAQTEKSIALTVFINMNTNSKPLSTYDIIVAEVESVMGKSLHDLETALADKYPNIERYSDLSDLILTTSALLQGFVPNQRGAWDMDKQQLVANWDIMELGLNRMAILLENEGIYDRKRLPTNAILAVIAALYGFIPISGDKLGKDELLLKKYIWTSFFTDRYENAAASRAFADHRAIKRIILSESKENGEPYTTNDVPIFSDHSLVETEELLAADWSNRTSILGRGILVAACRMGAYDFATGEKLTITNLSNRHYHHIYPDALLKEAQIDSFKALNCALITDKTNLSIGRKDPVVYLRDRYRWTDENIVRERLHSHLIPVKELANGGYEGLDEPQKCEKLKNDFDAFLSRRAELILKAVKLLVAGRDISSALVYQNHEDSTAGQTL